MALSDLKFEQGLAFEAYIWKQFGVPINHFEGGKLKEFFLVAAVTRSKLCINADSVSLMLQSCFGGHASRFKVSCLQNWSFKFSVSSKSVGFAIIKGGNCVNDLFSLGFFLWGNGGPDFHKEFRLYQQELDQEYTVVNRSGDRRSYAEAVQTPRFFRGHNSTARSPARSPVRSAATRPLSVSERLTQINGIVKPGLNCAQ